MVREIKSSLWDTAGGKEPNIRPKTTIRRPGAEAKFIEIAAANEVLSDDEVIHPAWPSLSR